MFLPYTRTPLLDNLFTSLAALRPYLENGIRLARGEATLRPREPFGTPMIASYLKSAFRNLARNRGFVSINLLGLATGMACCILAFLYVADEWSYDRFHQDADRIFRLESELVSEEGSVHESISVPGTAREILASDYPEVDAVTGFFWPGTYHFFSYGDVSNAEVDYYYADSEFFSVFTFPFAEGSPAEALVRPASVVLTRSAARRYFGEENPIGKTLTRRGFEDYTVTAVLEDIPRNSHFRFEFLLSLPANLQDVLHQTSRHTYLRLRVGNDENNLASKLDGLATSVYGSDNRVRLFLQPLTRIHLYSHNPFELGVNSDVRYLILFSGIALLILIVASINFINLTTARALRRAREVGLRKVLGAHRFQLIRQHLIESLLTASLSLPLALLLTELALPWVNAVSAKTLDPSFMTGTSFWLTCFGLIAFVGILGGSYPAFFITASQPGHILASRTSTLPGNGKFRNALVVLQFVISAVIIAGTLTVRNQLAFIQRMDLGFEKEQLVALNGTWALLEESRFDSFREALLEDPTILDAARLSIIPGEVQTYTPVHPEGFDQPIQAVSIAATENFADVLGVQLMEGRLFSGNGDREGSALINATMARSLGWNQPVGKSLRMNRSMGRPDQWGEFTVTVIGVVEDVHFASLRDEVPPMVFTMPLHYWAAWKTFVRVRGGQLARTMDHVHAVWSSFLPGRFLESTFVDDRVDEMYRADVQLGKLADGFAIVSVLLACLGLFSLSAYSAEQRTREIGVRKVFGASGTDILRLLSLDFLRLVLLSLLLAIPVAYVVSNRWLQTFAYQFGLDWRIFALTGFLVLGFTICSITVQCVRAARKSPVQALRYE